MSHGYFIFLIFLLFQYSFCAGCKYRETPDQAAIETDDDYLSSVSGTDAKKQKCFSLSFSDVFYKQCCYKKDSSNKETCVEGPDSNTVGSNGENGLYCPQPTQIANNCGMAGIYQPADPTICTDISLVNGYCCYVETSDKGVFCGSRDDMTDENKKEIPEDVRDYVRDYLNSIKPAGDTTSITTTVKSITCEGYYLKYYGLLILMAILILF